MTTSIEIVGSPSHTLFAGVVGLLQRFFQEEEFATPPGLIEARTAIMAASEKHWVAAGLADGKLAGVATASLLFTIESGDFAELADLYVLPFFRGRGLAQCLIDTAAEWGASHKAEVLEVVVTPGGKKRHNLDRFYTKHGFENTSRTILVRDLGGV
jgi:GNAT superfamily N-acetyltransferase